MRNNKEEEEGNDNGEKGRRFDVAIAVDVER